MSNERKLRWIHRFAEHSLPRQTAWAQTDSALNACVTVSVSTLPVIYIFAKWGQRWYWPHRADSPGLDNLKVLCSSSN